MASLTRRGDPGGTDQVARLEAGGDDPLHESSPPEVSWSRVNVAEAMPGVLTPLGWSIWRDAIEVATWRAYQLIGAVPRRAVHAGGPPERRIFAIFHGRVACNVDVSRRLGDSVPGMSGDVIEELYLGRVRPGIHTRRRYERYPVVAARMPITAALVPRRLSRMAVRTREGWAGTLAALDAGAPPGPLFAAARALFDEALVVHVVASMMAQMGYEAARRLAASAGRPGSELVLATGSGRVAELDVLADLWEVSRDRLALAEFVGRHGYHGPDEGEVASRSWREDASPLRTLVEQYRDLPEEESPAAVARRRAELRRALEDEVVAALPLGRRRLGRRTLAFAGRALAGREAGKACFLRALDAARAAARAEGRALAERGLLADAEDVFFLAADELVAAPDRDWRELVAHRRARHALHRSVELPTTWEGNPVAERDAPVDEAEGPLAGLGVSPGVVEGRVRVVQDPGTDRVEPGEILVCRTTDPSWVALFQLAAGLVIDIGGPLSHGAIVAREMGLPCVVNTVRGTRVLRTGDVVRIDGGTGGVELVRRS